MFDTLPIDEIIVGERRREDFGDIEGLASSIAKFGLFHPIVVDDQNNLVAGERRLIACKSLEWREIPCRLFRDLTDEERAEIELDENLKRKDLTPYEASKRILQSAEKIAPLISSVVDEIKNPRHAGRKSQRGAPKEEIAGALGVSKGALINAEKHVAAIEKYPELSISPTQKDAIDAARALDQMPVDRRTATRSKILAEGRTVIAEITNKPRLVKTKSASSKYSDNLSQIQTFITSIKAVGAEELTASWTERERHAFLSDLRSCRDDISALVSELEAIEAELRQAS
jgi:ParB-like chromosome segregation protein Spo0J